MLQDITPKTVTVKQGFKVTLEKCGFTREHETYTVTMFYGKRGNGTRIYSVPEFTHHATGTVMYGEAVSCA